VPTRTPRTRRFFFSEYIQALKKHYPRFYRKTVSENAEPENTVVAWLADHEEWLDGAEADKERFQPIAQRPWGYVSNAWQSWTPIVRPPNISIGYKGLVNMKPPFDLVLYSNLLWELKPKAVIEFGSFHGGSALWFADQLGLLCGTGEVHSFEKFIKCVSDRAEHPRLKFHETDISNVRALDKPLLRRIPHPWVVIDDANVNTIELFEFMSEFMRPGDYYVIEDAFLAATSEFVTKAARAIERARFRVDTWYADAFGENVTCAVNGWLRKM
jgi:cephalosporin hydroxylase